MDVFRKGKSELLAFTEKKLKVNGEVSWCGINGMIACVQEMEIAREGMGVLLVEGRCSCFYVLLTINPSHVLHGLFCL